MKWRVVFTDKSPALEIEAEWMDMNSRGDLLFYQADHEIKFAVSSGAWASVKRMDGNLMDGVSL